MDRDMDLFLPFSARTPSRSPMCFPIVPLQRQRSSEQVQNPFRAAMMDMEQKMQAMQRQMDVMVREYGSGMMEPYFVPKDDTFGARRGELIGLEKSIIKSEDGSKKLQLNLNVCDFRPEEINIKTKDGFLEIQAQHRDENEHGSSFRHYKRVFKLPKEVEPKDLKSDLTPDGILCIEGKVHEAIEAANEAKPMSITHE